MVSMHITINATLIVQVINFVIAYFLIRMFLLKPALKERIAEQDKQNALQSLITYQQKKIENTDYALRELWRESQNYYQGYKPTILTKQIFFESLEPSKPLLLSQKEEEKVASTLVRFIEEKIGERL
jgi:hypothetical protein